MLHDVGRIEEAASRIERWIAADAVGKNAIEAGEIAGYAGMFSEMRRFDLAATLLTSLGNRPGNVADDVFLSLARLHLEMNQPDKARDWLMAWRRQAIATGQAGGVRRAGARHGAAGSGAGRESGRPRSPSCRSRFWPSWPRPPSSLATPIPSIGSKRGSGPGSMLHGRSSRRNWRPSASRVELAQRWALSASADPKRTTEERIRLGNVLAKVDMRDAAAKELRTIVAADHVAPGALGALALLFLNAGQPLEGYRYFSNLSPTDADATREVTWGRAWLAAASHRGDEVVPLVEAAALDDPSRLQDLFFIASNNGETRLAVAAASRLFQQRPTSEVRTWLAQALIKAGRPGEALPHLRELLQGGAEVRDLYGLALERSGAGGELTALLKQRAADRGLPAEQRREAAFRLLKAGEREAAQAVFLDLAANAPPDGIDVQEMLFLWGPRPSAKALDWLEQRAKACGGTPGIRLRGFPF